MEGTGQYTFGDFQSFSNELLREEQSEQEQVQEQEQGQFFPEDPYAQLLTLQAQQEQLQQQQLFDELLLQYALPEEQQQPLPDDNGLFPQYTLPEEQQAEEQQQLLPNHISWDWLGNGLTEQQELQAFFPNPLANLSADELAGVAKEPQQPADQQVANDSLGPKFAGELTQFPTPSPEMGKEAVNGMDDDFYKSLPQPLSASTSNTLLNSPFPSSSITLLSSPSPAPATFDTRLPEMATPVADHPPHGVGEYAQGSEDATNDNGDVQMEDILLAPQPSSPRRPSVERTVGQALAPNTKGNRVAKRTRAVKSNSCDACRRSKVKCVTAEGAQGCNACLKKGHKCHVSGVDGRTHKTNRNRLDNTSSNVNDYLKDALLLCSEISDQQKEQRSLAKDLLQAMTDFKQVRSCVSIVEKTPQKLFPFNQGPFRPPMLEGQTKLAVVRNYRGPQLRLAAQHQGKIIASLLAMIAFGSQNEAWIASSHVAKAMTDNTRLDSDYIALSIREHCSIPDDHPVYETMRQGIEKCFDTAQ
ncbi:hypothetical protein LY76DRAFT_664969 [Colletotrichum caudatum]|nr:hypothetical protein LY76DRAFT_664969 [Colletotrichum caudatum]